MNILIVTGNPKTENHTKKIAEAYESISTKKGNVVRMIDVYSPSWTLPYATGMKLSDEDPSKKIIATSQECVTWADEIVFIHPIWWSYMPAGLKNWIDSVISPGFAYKYIDGAAVPLLHKKAKVFCTAGSVAPYYTTPFVRLCTPLHLLWKYALLRFVGIDLIDFKICDKMNTVNSAPPEGHFEKFIKRVEFSAEFIQ